MTDERLNEIELHLLRAAAREPVDSRQRIVGLGLELVEGLRRCKEVQASATALSARRLMWHQTSWALLKEVTALLSEPTARIGGAEWMQRVSKWLQKVKDNQ